MFVCKCGDSPEYALLCQSNGVSHIDEEGKFVFDMTNLTKPWGLKPHVPFKGARLTPTQKQAAAKNQPSPALNHMLYVYSDITHID